MPGFFGAVIALVGLILVVTLVFFPIAIGSAIRMSAETLQTGRSNLGSALRFAASKLIGIWALSIVVGIIVFLGTIALTVPGIILAIMFSLSLPVLLIESPGVIATLGRSRRLVSNRWLKTFAVIIVLGLMILVATAVVMPSVRHLESQAPW